MTAIEKKELDVTLNNRTVKLLDLGRGVVQIGDQTYNTHVEVHGKNYIVHVNDYTFTIEENNGRIFLNGSEVDFSYRPSLPKLERKGSGKKHGSIITAMIPGTIVEIMVKEGEQVKVNDTLLFLEAMKMRNEIVSPINGTIKKVAVTKGESVKKDQVLIVIEPIDTP